MWRDSTTTHCYSYIKSRASVSLASSGLSLSHTHTRTHTHTPLHQCSSPAGVIRQFCRVVLQAVHWGGEKVSPDASVRTAVPRKRASNAPELRKTRANSFHNRRGLKYHDTRFWRKHNKLGANKNATCWCFATRVKHHDLSCQQVTARPVWRRAKPSLEKSTTCLRRTEENWGDLRDFKLLHADVYHADYRLIQDQDHVLRPKPTERLDEERFVNSDLSYYIIVLIWWPRRWCVDSYSDSFSQCACLAAGKTNSTLIKQHVCNKSE